MKIGVFSKFPPERTGTGIYAQSLIDALSKKCKVVKIGFGNSDCDYKVDLTKNFVEDVRTIVEKEKLDVFHLQHAASVRTFGLENRNIWIAQLKTLLINLKLIKMMSSLNIPTVCTMHDMISTPRNPKEFVIKLLEKKMTESSDYVTVHSMMQKKVIEKYNTNVEFIYHGVNSIDSKLKKGKNILCLGVITPAKGFEYVINAMKYLPDFRLKIAGQAQNKIYTGKLKKLVTANNLDNIEIEFGWVPETKRKRLYKRSSLVVLSYLKTSRYIVSGTLHDAISYRLPVVVSNISGMSEMVKKFKCGVVVNSISGESIATAIKEVYRNYKKYVSGVDKYRKAANWEKIAEQHLKLYKKAIKENS